MIISIASGKGGTGKTTVSTSLFLSLDNVQFLDCDVEEPNAHIFIKPELSSFEDVNLLIPEVNKDKCTLCGECQRNCAFNAIAVVGNSTMVFDDLCHGCGVCSYVCPENAITEIEKKIGVVETSKKLDLDFVQGILDVGENIAPPVINAVKKKINKSKTVIIDAPPGTSCPVITSIQGSDFCVLVTEPTPFGLNDLKLAVQVVNKLKIPFGVVINKFDLGDNETELFCKKNNIPIIMRIPFMKDIAKAYSNGIPLITAKPEFKTLFTQMFQEIKNIINHK